MSQALVLFLTAVSYMFSPFVADLHERGERERLNALFKQITRWTLALDDPAALLFMTSPGPVLRLFGSDTTRAPAWLRILLIGQIVNVSVGAAGFVLIMVGRTTWDLLVYASSFLLISRWHWLIPHPGPKGAAIAQATTLGFLERVPAVIGLAVREDPAVRPPVRAPRSPAAIGAAAMIGIHSVLGGPKGRWICSAPD